MVDSVKKLVFDIETLGKDLEALNKEEKEYFLYWAQKYENSEEDVRGVVEKNIATSPLTSQVIALAILNPETLNGAVYFQSPGKNESFKEKNIEYKSASEEEILKWFWQTIKGYNEVISFNGRGFDIPFIMLRSAIFKIRPSVDLTRDRYGSYGSAIKHIDLLDRLTFFGSLKRRLPLNFWTNAFNIESPKKDFTGEDVKRLFKEEKYKEIAKYCLGDVYATAQLYDYWDKYLNNI